MIHAQKSLCLRPYSALSDMGKIMHVPRPIWPFHQHFCCQQFNSVFVIGEYHLVIPCIFSIFTVFHCIFSLYIHCIAYCLVLWCCDAVLAAEIQTHQMAPLDTAERSRLEGIQLKPEANNKLNSLPIRLCFINVHNYTYSNPKPIPLTTLQIQ